MNPPQELPPIKESQEMEVCPTEKLREFLQIVYPEIGKEKWNVMTREDLISMIKSSPQKIELKGKQFHLGRAVKFHRTCYTHYGVICAIREEKVFVVHYSGDPTNKINSYVRVDCLDAIAAKSAHEMQMYKDQIEPFESIANAISRLNENTYNLVSNNCEHFASWCCTNRHQSNQVRTATATLAAFATVALVGFTTAVLARVFGTTQFDEEFQPSETSCPYCKYRSDTKHAMELHISTAHETSHQASTRS
eukprot:TRINITY_DN12880_c0_g1_i1.p1 TRINITY_DN12880_c0_g1~~TRINITY_DN12880_c0_g1_i1.p1  ORF type:complete len:250 (-),score=41.09 TRINITY_DN12880_c0_g1_i1:38-787(-)